MSSSSFMPWKLYVSRGLSAWGDRMWTFGAGIFMAKFEPEDFRLVAIYGFVLSISVILFGAYIGQWIDKSRRLSAAITFLLIQNVTTSISCLFIALNIYPRLISYIVIGIASVSNLASLGSRIIIERDWIVVMSDDDPQKLAKTNAVFRTIDLSCLVLSPLGVGFLFDYTSNTITAVIIGVWNMVSFLVEFVFLWLIYRENPKLAEKTINVTASSTSTSSVRSWIAFFLHPVRDAGLALSFLYMTVLGFDNVTWAYCLSLGVHESVLGGLVGGSALVGILGSVAFPSFRKRWGLRWTGMFGISCLLCALVPSVVSIWIPGSPFDPKLTTSNDVNKWNGFPSVIWFIIGIMAARFGLWIFDLSVSQIFQENVEGNIRGSISGVQGSCNSLMNMIKFILVILFPDKRSFGWLILMSYGSICFGALFYSFYLFQSKKSRLSS